MSIYSQIHRYLIYLSFLFLFLSSAHLFWLYVGGDAKVRPVIGGTVSIGMIGNAPSLFPSEYGTDVNQDILLNLLYRGLLRYNLETQELEGNLANCDIGTNIREIRCYLKKGVTWSDGSPITVGDVIRTYSAIKSTKLNEALKGQLEGIDIRDEGEFITFRSKTADVLALDALIYPIMKAEDINMLLSGSGGNIQFRTSGAYTLTKRAVSPEENQEIITLARSINQNENEYAIERIIFRFFPSQNEMVFSQDTLSVIPDPRKELEGLSERFQRIDYHGSQYYSAFFNVDKIPGDLRRYIASIVQKDYRVPSQFTPIQNPFLGEEKMSFLGSGSNIDFSEILNRSGYYTKKQLIAKPDIVFPEKKPKTVSVNLSTNKYISSPTREKFYGTSSSDFYISGVPPIATESIIINNYKLKTFTQGRGVYNYRASLALGTLKPGKNIIDITFQGSKGVIAKEQIIIYSSNNASEIEAQKATYLGNSQSAVLFNEQQKISLEKEKEKNLGIIQGLNETSFYNKELKPLVLTIASLGNSKSLAEEISQILQKYGFQTQVKILEETDMVQIVKNGEKDYDILIAGVDLGMIHYNLFPFLHSGQVKSGLNFSKIKNNELDSLLEQTKSGLLKVETLQKAQKEIINLLNKEAVMLPLGSPGKRLYFDKSIKNILSPKRIPLASFLPNIFIGSYTQEGRIIYWHSKNIIGFFDWWKREFLGIK